MGKIINICFIFLIILSGAFTLPTCIDWLTAKSGEIGKVGDLQVEENETKSNDYSITYNLDGGTADNPIKYNLFTNTFTLNNPTKPGYAFIGWTGTNISEPKLTVTICKGSAGDLEFTAKYKLLLTAPTIRFEDNNQYLRIAWDSVEEATKYIVNVNGIDCDTTLDTYANIRVEYLRVGDNILKVKASDGSVCGPYSNTLTYNIVNSLSAPILTFNNNVYKFSKVDNAFDYKIIVGNCNFTFSKYNSLSNYPAITYDDSYYYIDLNNALVESGDVVVCDTLFYGLENYSYINSTEHKAPVSVLAIPKFDTITASAESNKIDYVYDLAVNFNKFNSVVETITKNEMSQRYDTFDTNYGANLCVIVPTSFLTDMPEPLYTLHSQLKVELYQNDTLVTSCVGKRYTGSNLTHFKIQDIELGQSYTLKIMLSNNSSRNIVYLKDISYVCSSNTNLITCISLS